MRILGYSPGQWASIVLVTFAALVLLQLTFDALKKFGGGAGNSVASFGQTVAGLN